MKTLVYLEDVINEIKSFDNCGMITRSVNHVCENIRTEVKEVKAIHIPKGATNGDMMKVLFPGAKTWEIPRDDFHCACIEFKDVCEIKTFPLSWWNAPYRNEVIE
ncbi:MAG: hypothetical protein K6E54_00695 [Bacteroidaceae bacterium]|nr:hypothetical protein [Bacteroidaceae bacterium]